MTGPRDTRPPTKHRQLESALSEWGALLALIVSVLLIFAAGTVGLRLECERLRQTDPARALETCGP